MRKISATPHPFPQGAATVPLAWALPPSASAGWACLPRDIRHVPRIVNILRGHRPHPELNTHDAFHARDAFAVCTC